MVETCLPRGKRLRIAYKYVQYVYIQPASLIGQERKRFTILAYLLRTVYYVLVYLFRKDFTGYPNSTNLRL